MIRSLIDLIYKYYHKYQELIVYFIVGVITTLINIVVFMGLSYVGLSVVPANTLAFVVAVLFAYWANSLFVFKAKMAVNNSVMKATVSIRERIFLNIFTSFNTEWFGPFPMDGDNQLMH